MSPPLYCNPVHPGYFADPFVWRTDDGYVAIGTGAHEAAGQVADLDGPAVFPLRRSDDLVHWQDAGFALVPVDAAHGNAYWAPEVACAAGRWWLYYSVGHGDRRHQLRVAASDTPLGPYLDVGALTDPAQLPFAIDPHPFRDVDGRWYLFHARDLLDLRDAQGVALRAGTALVVAPLRDMTQLDAPVRLVARARCDWQRFAADRAIYGQVLDWHTLEGPCVRRHDGRYWCFYSGGCWQDASYGVDYVVADGIEGPWSDAGAEEGPRVLRSVAGAVAGPGHCSIVDDDAGAPWLCYHAWDRSGSRRELCIDPLFFGAGGPRACGPSRGLQPAPMRATPSATS